MEDIYLPVNRERINYQIFKDHLATYNTVLKAARNSYLSKLI